MILKGSSRAYGANLATHLMRTDENEHVIVHELRGFVADNLHDAFKEAEAVSRATKCQKYLFSLSLNPPLEASPSVEDFTKAADRIEEKLGLVGQPRAIVFHEKESRRHAHVVWSRIDAETMTAREMDFFKRKLQDVSRELYLENDWKMPRGLMNSAERDPKNFSRSEWEQAKRLGQDPRWIRQIGQDCWQRSDNGAAFQRALEDRGVFLAKGDKRGHVLVDSLGGIHSLPRVLNLKTKEVRARLGAEAALRSVQAVQQEIGARLTPAMRAHIKASRKSFEERARPVGLKKSEMAKDHRAEREQLESRQRKERETQARIAQAKVRRGVLGLWDRITGRFQDMRRETERAAELTRKRQEDERRTLIEAQLEKRRALQAQIAALRTRQAQQLLDLRRDLGRFIKFTRPTQEQKAREQSKAPSRSRGLDHDR